MYSSNVKFSHSCTKCFKSTKPHNLQVGRSQRKSDSCTERGLQGLRESVGYCDGVSLSRLGIFEHLSPHKQPLLTEAKRVHLAKGKAKFNIT